MCADPFATLNSREPGSALIRAIDKLLSDDRYLFTFDVNERSITHRLACCLQSEFPEWHVDCEYNRDVNSSDQLHFRKFLYGLVPTPSADDIEGKSVFPDIIVHKRGSSNNHLVIEVKKSNSSVSARIDLEKLKAYKSQLGYAYALFLKFEINDNPSLLHAEWVDT